MKVLLLIASLGAFAWRANTSSVAAPIPATGPAATSGHAPEGLHIDPRKPGVYRARRWEYWVRYEKVDPPAHAQWSQPLRDTLWLWGELRFDDRTLPSPPAMSCILTPWGLMDWIGKPGQPGTSPAGAGWGLLPFRLLPEPMPDPVRGEAAPDKPASIDARENAVYRSGRWEYQTHAERQTIPRPHFGNVTVDVHWGALLVDGRPVAAHVQDCVRTPWGLMLWEGEQPLATDTGIRGPGWRPLPFTLLPEPQTIQDPTTRPSSARQRVEHQSH